MANLMMLYILSLKNTQDYGASVPQKGHKNTFTVLQSKKHINTCEGKKEAIWDAGTCQRERKRELIKSKIQQ